MEFTLQYCANDTNYGLVISVFTHTHNCAHSHRHRAAQPNAFGELEFLIRTGYKKQATIIQFDVLYATNKIP